MTINSKAFDIHSRVATSLLHSSHTHRSFAYTSTHYYFLFHVSVLSRDMPFAHSLPSIFDVPPPCHLYISHCYFLYIRLYLIIMQQHHTCSFPLLFLNLHVRILPPPSSFPDPLAQSIPTESFRNVIVYFVRKHG